ncbi:hypothetical protein J2Z76_001859 [Sedimentibacter acidaminivorans]|jgi:uncharacterized protein DUF1836|uniref:DUF1836 domain-containing protein n=1 Tax=Sedimentibacter acidaminivorans TaxID=913099 RepID=A0ABS4GF50_9FIRM|nr:DUF1836 domain-containing protein [Sedimentibacter acidaminivorans]MBP1925995.1 hypothetical protein [Sedimentibacter acidaminivorans]
MDDNLELYEYSKKMSEAKLIKWCCLPKSPIYCDNLLQIVKDELSFMQIGDEKLITKSMVNNYVKWGMMPKPLKKKYERLHIAHVIVITILKQILPISEIKYGIQLQIVLHGKERAYDAFAEALEESMRKVFVPILQKQNTYVLDERRVDYDKLAISSITTSLSNKLLTEKIVETKIKKYNNLAKSQEVDYE